MRNKWEKKKLRERERTKNNKRRFEKKIAHLAELSGAANVVFALSWLSNLAERKKQP